MTTVKGRFILLIFIGFLIFCELGPELASAESPYNKNISEEACIEGVPYFGQKEFECGPSSLAMVLKYWGEDISPEDIVKSISIHGGKGALTIDLLLYAQQRDFAAQMYESSWEDLKSKINDKYPLLVMIDVNPALPPVIPFLKHKRVNHFLVVLGYSEKRNKVICHSGNRANVNFSKSGFLNRWGRANYWALLICPKANPARDAQ